MHNVDPPLPRTSWRSTGTCLFSPLLKRPVIDGPVLPGNPCTCSYMLFVATVIDLLEKDRPLNVVHSGAARLQYTTIDLQQKIAE